MIETEISLQVNAPYGDVWKIVSDVDRDPTYWKSIVRMRIIAREPNSISREIITSDGSKFQQRITLFPKEGVHIKWSSGQVSGIRDIMLVENGHATVIRIQASYKFGRSFPAPKEIVEKRQSEEERALYLIKRAVESKVSSVENRPRGANDRT